MCICFSKCSSIGLASQVAENCKAVFCSSWRRKREVKKKKTFYKMSRKAAYKACSLRQHVCTQWTTLCTSKTVLPGRRRRYAWVSFPLKRWDHNLSHDGIRRAPWDNAANVERSEGWERGQLQACLQNQKYGTKLSASPTVHFNRNGISRQVAKIELLRNFRIKTK